MKTSQEILAEIHRRAGEYAWKAQWTFDKTYETYEEIHLVLVDIIEWIEEAAKSTDPESPND